MEKAMLLKRWGRASWLVAGVAGVVLLLGTVACSSVTDLRRPKTARVILSGPPSTTLQLTTTANFLVTEGSVQLIGPSTDTVTVPFDQVYPLGSPARFYVQATNLASQAVTITMKVFIDERTWYNEQKSLAPDESVELIYRYDEPAIR
jgi:hypothetical protein